MDFGFSPSFFFFFLPSAPRFLQDAAPKKEGDCKGGREGEGRERRRCVLCTHSRRFGLLAAAVVGRLRGRASCAALTLMPQQCRGSISPRLRYLVVPSSCSANKRIITQNMIRGDSYCCPIVFFLAPGSNNRKTPLVCLPPHPAPAVFVLLVRAFPATPRPTCAPPCAAT